MAIKISSKVLLLPLKKPFKISHGTFPQRRSLIIELQSGEYTGYGEATEISYYNWSIEEFQKKLKEKTHILQSIQVEDPRKIKPLLEEHFADCRPLQSAIDCALWDLFTRAQSMSLIDFLRHNAADIPASSYTIGIGTAETMLTDIEQCSWPTIKLKLGSKDDLEILKLLTEKGVKRKLRLDINGAWTVAKFKSALPYLKSLDIEFLEQPLAVSDKVGMSALKQLSPIPLIADESCQTIEDIEACAESFDGINIKLMKCGGITSFIEMASLARTLGLKVMGGCMTESSIGISALCHLATLMDYIDADGAELLSQDPARGVKVEHGIISYPESPGLGARLRSH